MCCSTDVKYMSWIQVVEELVSNVAVIEKLTNFQYKDKNGRDWGLNVRERAKQLASLVTDPERMRAERKKVRLCCFTAFKLVLLLSHLCQPAFHLSHHLHEESLEKIHLVQDIKLCMP